MKKAKISYAELKQFNSLDSIGTWYRQKGNYEKAKEYTDELNSFLSRYLEFSLTLYNLQERCSVRKINVKDILEMILEIKDKINLPNKFLDGITVIADYNAQSFPAAYKYMPESTIVKFVFTKSGIKITDICRDRCNEVKFSVVLTEQAKQEIIKRTISGIETVKV